MATNGSTNVTFPISSEPMSAQVIKIVACVVVLIVSLAGNVLIITVVHKNTSMRKTINYFIVNMAVSDLIVPLVILPRIIIETATSPQGWLATTGSFGEFLCKIMTFLSDITMVVSILSLICIAVDRFCAVVFPLKLSLITSRVRMGLIAFTWAFSTLYYSPLLYGMRLQTQNGKTQCILKWSEEEVLHLKVHKAYMITTTVLYIIVPAIVLTFLYSSILVVVRLKIVSLQEQQGNIAQHRRAANNNKLLKLALLTVGSFAICYGPFNVYAFYFTLILNWKITDLEFFYRFTFAAEFLAYTNSALNPCIYFIFTENFRRGLLRIFNRGPPVRTDTMYTTETSRATRMLQVDYTRNPKRATMERDGTVERETLIDS